MAAQGRNAGFGAITTKGEIDYVQFIDDDRGVEAGWIAAAQAILDQELSIGVVTGWRTETNPTSNAYHTACEVKRPRPAGDIALCRGI